MKRIALIMLVMLSVQSINAQRYERPSIRYSKEETYEYLKDYVGLWRYEDTTNKIVFMLELITYEMDNTITIEGRYSILKDGVYITNEFNDENLVNSEDPSIIGFYGKVFEFVSLYFTDRGNKNREAGSTEFGEERSYLHAYQEDGKWKMRWHITVEGGAKVVFDKNDIPGDFWTVPEDCVLEKVE
jgi:hypothetical protein